VARNPSRSICFMTPSEPVSGMFFTMYKSWIILLRFSHSSSVGIVDSVASSSCEAFWCDGSEGQRVELYRSFRFIKENERSCKVEKARRMQAF
jgi:hypothetical protein